MSYVEGDIIRISDKDIEMVHVGLKNGHMKHISLTALYRPPGGNLQMAIDKIEQCIGIDKHRDRIVIGDFNIDWLRSLVPKLKCW